jgi:hypothetical protein
MAKTSEKSKTPEKSEPRWAELSDEVLESVETGRKQAIEAVRKFVDEVGPLLPEESRRKAVVDAAIDLADDLVTSRMEFFRSVVRSAGKAMSK